MLLRVGKGALSKFLTMYKCKKDYRVRVVLKLLRMIKKVVKRIWKGDNIPCPYTEKSIWYLFGIIPIWSFTVDTFAY